MEVYITVLTYINIFTRRQNGGNTFLYFFVSVSTPTLYLFAFQICHVRSAWLSPWGPIKIKNKPAYSKTSYYIRYDHFTTWKLTVKELSREISRDTVSQKMYTDGNTVIWHRHCEKSAGSFFIRYIQNFQISQSLSESKIAWKSNDKMAILVRNRCS